METGKKKEKKGENQLRWFVNDDYQEALLHCLHSQDESLARNTQIYSCKSKTQVHFKLQACYGDAFLAIDNRI